MATTGENLPTQGNGNRQHIGHHAVYHTARFGARLRNGEGGQMAREAAAAPFVGAYRLGKHVVKNVLQAKPVADMHADAAQREILGGMSEQDAYVEARRLATAKAEAAKIRWHDRLERAKAYGGAAGLEIVGVVAGFGGEAVNLVGKLGGLWHHTGRAVRWVGQHMVNGGNSMVTSGAEFARNAQEVNEATMVPFTAAEALRTASGTVHATRVAELGAAEAHARSLEFRPPQATAAPIEQPLDPADPVTQP